MVHKGTVRIETERLILRRFVIDDADRYMRTLRSAKLWCRAGSFSMRIRIFIIGGLN